MDDRDCRKRYQRSTIRPTCVVPFCCTDETADFANTLFVQPSIWFSISLPADRVAGSQTGWATSLGSMSQLLPCGTLPASRILGVSLGQTMTTTYRLECRCLLIFFFFKLTDCVATLYACGTSVEPRPYAGKWTGQFGLARTGHGHLGLTDSFFYSFLLLTCPLFVHALLHSAIFTTLLQNHACPRIISTCIVISHMLYACIIYFIMGASYGNLYARFNMFYQVDLELAVVNQTNRM
jgi:hypothetical protein